MLTASWADWFGWNQVGGWTPGCRLGASSTTGVHPKAQVVGKVSVGIPSTQEAKQHYVFKPQLATRQPYPFSQSKPHHQAHVVRQGGSLDSQPGEEKQVFAKQ